MAAREGQLGAQDRLVWKAINELAGPIYRARMAMNDSRKGADKRALSALNEVNGILRTYGLQLDEFMRDS